MLIDVLEILPVRYRLMIPVLSFFGYFIKHNTKIPNTFIPYILFALSVSIGAVTRYTVLSNGAMALSAFGWLDVLVLHGVLNGIQCTLISCGGYEVVRAIAYKRKRKELIMLKKKPFFKMLLSFIISSAVFVSIAMALGSSAYISFAKITDGWIFGILFMAIFDLVDRLFTDKESISKTYIVMQMMILLNVISFSISSSTDKPFVCYVGLACTVLFGAGAGVLYKFASDNVFAHGKAFNEERLEKEWSSAKKKLKKLSKEKQQELLEKTLAFKLVNDSIANGLDFDRPIIVFNDCAWTVRSATENGVDQGSVTEAKNYIASVLEVK